MYNSVVVGPVADKCALSEWAWLATNSARVKCRPKVSVELSYYSNLFAITEDIKVRLMSLVDTVSPDLYHCHSYSDSFSLCVFIMFFVPISFTCSLYIFIYLSLSLFLSVISYCASFSLCAFLMFFVPPSLTFSLSHTHTLSLFSYLLTLALFHSLDNFIKFVVIVKFKTAHHCILNMTSVKYNSFPLDAKRKT